MAWSGPLSRRNTGGPRPCPVLLDYSRPPTGTALCPKIGEICHFATTASLLALGADLVGEPSFASIVSPRSTTALLSVMRSCRPGLFISGSNFSIPQHCDVGRASMPYDHVLELVLVDGFPPPVEPAPVRRGRCANNGVDFTLSTALVYPHPVCPPGYYCPHGDYL